MIDPSQNSSNISLSISAREKLLNRLQAHRDLIKNSISNQNPKKEEEKEKHDEINFNNEMKNDQQSIFKI